MNRPVEGMTVPRTVTESDTVTFACLTGDYSRMHLDVSVGDLSSTFSNPG